MKIFKEEITINANTEEEKNQILELLTIVLEKIPLEKQLKIAKKVIKKPGRIEKILRWI